MLNLYRQHSWCRYFVYFTIIILLSTWYDQNTSFLSFSLITMIASLTPSSGLKYVLARSSINCLLRGFLSGVMLISGHLTRTKLTTSYKHRSSQLRHPKSTSQPHRLLLW